MNSYDIVVVGGGHAACEAALAAARCGARIAMVTHLKSAIGRMSCNPSIGGIAKSHLVFEIDALGGEMAKNADYTGIQFKTLNTSKGPAVQATRSQNDKDAYSRRMISVICSTWNIDVIEDTAVDIVSDGDRVRGIRLANGPDLACMALMVAAGTFLNGRIHIGGRSWDGGRIDEPACSGLSDALVRLGHHKARLKTGTPPRLLGETLDYSAMTEQPGAMPAPFFSWEVRKEDGMFHVEHSTDEIPWRPGFNQSPMLFDPYHSRNASYNPGEPQPEFPVWWPDLRHGSQVLSVCALKTPSGEVHTGDELFLLEGEFIVSRTKAQAA